MTTKTTHPKPSDMARIRHPDDLDQDAVDDAVARGAFAEAIGTLDQSLAQSEARIHHAAGVADERGRVAAWLRSLGHADLADDLEGKV